MDQLSRELLICWNVTQQGQVPARLKANGNFNDATVPFSASQYNHVMSWSDAVDLESLWRTRSCF